MVLGVLRASADFWMRASETPCLNTWRLHIKPPGRVGKKQEEWGLLTIISKLTKTKFYSCGNHDLKNCAKFMNSAVQILPRNSWFCVFSERELRHAHSWSQGTGGDQSKDHHEAAQWGVSEIAGQLQAQALFLGRGSDKEQSPWGVQNTKHICLGAQEEGKLGEPGGMTIAENGIEEQPRICLCWEGGECQGSGDHKADSGGQMRLPGAARQSL